MSDVADSLAFLSQSTNRAEVLRLLQDEEGLDRYEIEEQVEASRRTVIRTLDALTEHGYVEDGDGQYRLTAFGSELVDSYQAFAEQAQLAHEFAPFLTHLPDGVFDQGLRCLEDAELITATEGSPYAVLDRTLTIRRQATQIRELSPIIEQKSIAQLAQRIRDNEPISVEVVLSESAMEASEIHPDYQDDQQLINQADQTDIYLASTEIPFLLCIADDTVAIGVTNDMRKPHALVVSTNADVKQWAEQTYEAYQEHVQPVPQ
jgi:predicted transcriptional regulator